MNPMRMTYPRIVALALGLTLAIPLSARGAPKADTIAVRDKKGKPVILYKESHALVIGISFYSSGWPPLPGVKEDVKAVSKALQKQGFHVVTVENPNQEELESALTDFILTYGLQPKNRLLFYFAGHGYTHKPSYASNDPHEWMGYFVTRDAPRPSAGLAPFRRHSISMQEVANLALEIEAKHVLFMFDSCFSGSVFSLSRAIPQDIQERTAKPVRQFITSGSADQEVPDQSIFRRQFTEALAGEGDLNGDGFVTGSELGLFLEEKVTNYSRRSQTPQYGKIRHHRLDKGDFVFVLAKADRPKSEPVVAPSNGEQLDDLEEQRRALAAERKRLEAQRKLLEERRRLAREKERLADLHLKKAQREAKPAPRAEPERDPTKFTKIEPTPQPEPAPEPAREPEREPMTFAKIEPAPPPAAPL